MKTLGIPSYDFQLFQVVKVVLLVPRQPLQLVIVLIGLLTL